MRVGRHGIYEALEDIRVSLKSENWPLFSCICSSRSLTTENKRKKKLDRILAGQSKLGTTRLKLMGIVKTRAKFRDKSALMDLSA